MPEPGTPRTKCTNCAGVMVWDAGSGKLKCGSCGTLRAPAAGGDVVETDLAAGLARAPRGRLGAGAKQLKCQECGATVELPDGLVATRCSFCDSPSVLASDARGDLIVPESVVPFAVGRDQAVASFNGWLKKLWFRPSDLRQKASVEELRGVYVPFWTFDSQVSSHWTADAGYHYYTEETSTDSQGREQTRRVQHTRWEPASGNRRDSVEDHLVCASAGIPPRLAGRAFAFDTKALIGYSADYLQGFAAESYALDLEHAWKKGRDEIGHLQDGRCGRDVPGDTHRDLRTNHHFADTTFKHVLLPLWIAAFRYRDQVHRFLVNGQTGGVSGTAPKSWAKILLFIVMLLAIAAGIVFLVLYLRRDG